MQSRTGVSGVLGGLLTVALIVVGTSSPAVRAQGAAALTGVVSSQEEGKMEGVVVTTRPVGGNFDVSVVSDAQGKYTFPSSHLPAGHYAIKTRAVGYDLADPGTVDVVGGKTATRDLTLQKTKDITRQLTSVEWLMSVAGTDEQKAMVQKQMAACTYCHNLEVIVKSNYSADEFPLVITRMQKYYPDGTTYGIYEGRGRRTIAFAHELESAEKNPGWGFWPNVTKKDLGAYLASINMSGGKSLPKEFKTLPRPRGKGTRVIITQYDTPRRDTVPHDSDVDSKGRVWYTDQSAPFLGVFDTKTSTFEEFALPASKKWPFTGGSDVQVDQDDNVWFAKVHDEVNNHFGLLHKFDARTKTLIPSKIARDAFYQFLAMGGDGKIWAGFGEFYRVDPKTLEMDFRFAWIKSPNLPKGPRAMGYGIGADPQGNPWLLDYGGSGLVRVDVKTKAIKFYPTPTPNAGPRRGVFDKQGRFWFGEYTGDKLGMFDSTSEKFMEYDPGIKWFAPYTASNPDKLGRVWAPSNTADRLMRVDSKTGEVVVYLMPTQDFDTKQMRIDPVSGTTLVFVNKRAARITKVETLD